MTALTSVLTMSDGHRTIKVSTVEGYVQAVWDGFKVVDGQAPPASTREKIHATLADLDAAIVNLAVVSPAQVTAAISAAVAAGVPPAVANAMAADTTVKNAAAAAANTALNDAGVLHGTVVENGLFDDVFNIRDSTGRPSWLAIAADGGPPPRVKAILQAIAQAGLGFTVAKSEVLGRAYNITDATGREAFWIDESGAIGFQKVTPATAARLVASLSSAGFDLVPQKYRDAQGVDHKIASGINVVCWGDSLTIGSGNATLPGSGVVTTATTYPQRLQALLTARLGFGVSTVYNAGIAGESSVTITARANATPLRLTPAGGSVPASGAVTVTLSNINGQAPAPLLSGGETDGVLWVNGVPVPGAISLSGGTYSFTRTTPGTSIPVGSPAAFAYTFAEAHRDDIAIIAIGQNGPTHPRPLYDAKAIISQMKALDKRYLIVNRPTSTDAEDSAYHDEFGRRFFDLRKYMIGYGLSDAGITPTAQDTTDMANGVVPSSLRVDAIHFNAAGYWVWGNKIYNRLVELGWV